ncbi:sugar-non-specific nuclease inhibitor NuiA-like protein [Adhaeribacter aerolatus]|uniref:Sugar-non-specific nuclease inhibitor NuiA-like protein n=1 Tax=Adhaeribacter aerolatus TaxID=670289 RepID=A0A512B5U8_9BACT|nr:nuclease A inhibitor family protein [Adhaeribacter aerolatus]GEO07342.1 sugar-non-specific nuclease inhibitor NuiA-like protein [Adhaeribacter aerolatus]
MAEVNAPAVDIFMKNLQERCEGLFYLSESEYPLEPIILEVSDTAAVTNADVLKLAGQPEDAPVEVVDLPYFLRNQTADVPDPDEFIQTMVQRFRDLQAFLLAQLQEVKVYRIGRREIQVYALGKLNQSQLAGFKTTSVET